VRFQVLLPYKRADYMTALLNLALTFGRVLSTVSTCPTLAHIPRAFLICCLTVRTSSLSWARIHPRYQNKSTFSRNPISTWNSLRRARAAVTANFRCVRCSAPSKHTCVWMCRGYRGLHYIMQCLHHGKVPSLNISTVSFGCRSWKWQRGI
jgi:hypothetical protein